MKITREQLKNIVREVMTEESEYQTFFKKALEKTGKSIPQMSDEEKKKFFNSIDRAWKGKGEKREQVEELTKAQEKLPPALKKAIEKKEKNESINEISISQIAKKDAEHLDRHVGGKSKREVKAFVDRVYKFHPKDVRQYMVDAFMDYQKNNRTLKYLTLALRVMHQDMRE